MPEQQNSMQRPLYKTSAGQRSFYYGGVTLWKDLDIKYKKWNFYETLKNDLHDAKHAKTNIELSIENCQVNMLDTKPKVLFFLPYFLQLVNSTTSYLL
jgi:hypothetical protein